MEPKVHYRAHRARQFSQAWPRRIKSMAYHPIYLKYILILFSHLILGLTNYLFASGFPTKSNIFLFSQNQQGYLSKMT
jgi:hypothetical protein